MQYQFLKMLEKKLVSLYLHEPLILLKMPSKVRTLKRAQKKDLMKQQKI
jgi:hypothetical protein